MIRIDAYYLYQKGFELHPIQNISIFPSGEERAHTKQQCLSILYPAQFALDGLITKSVFRMRNIYAAADLLKRNIEWAIEHCSEVDQGKAYPTTDLIFQLQESHREFEVVLKAELSNLDLYLVGQKSAFDTRTLVEDGARSFPEGLSEKVPQAAFDVAQAMRCIAFELSTAAAFHLHRANETVLGVYWDTISEGKKRPRSQTLGSYISEMEKLGKGNPAVISALKDIKNLYRNPTIHAEMTLANTEEAIDLTGAVRTAVSTMLREIPSIVTATP
ncbi:MAG: hypothetical protein ACI84R_001357 [Candidatus Azotimanducaceae bacterium]|jgi:hypothetical protein